MQRFWANCIITLCVLFVTTIVLDRTCFGDDPEPGAFCNYWRENVPFGAYHCENTLLCVFGNCHFTDPLNPSSKNCKCQ